MALESARARLAQGDADGTLALLDQYAASYPSGRLKPEADVLRIDALSKSGRSAAAKKLAESFLQHYPNSVLAARARGHLND
jgi:outer membrane protein assembly factor BamD (BamD/ComL family)